MNRHTLLAMAIASALVGCGGKEKGPKMQDYDTAGVPLDRGKAECKALAKQQASGLGKGSITNGIADDLYSDCLMRRGYFGQ
jgi:hypothetical protein